MDDRFEIKFKFPIRFMVNNIPLRTRKIPKFLSSLRPYGLEIDGWRFNIDYGVLYFNQEKEWRYYSLLGIVNKRVLDIGGGCGESAKFFLENGAKSVHVIDNNHICMQYLKYNCTNHSNLTYEIKDFNPSKIHFGDYDLIKLDIEGYETLLINYLKLLTDKDIVLEAHSNYVIHEFLNAGFKLYSDSRSNTNIYCGSGVVSLYRVKK